MPSPRPIHLHDATNKSWAMCGESAKAAKAVTFGKRGGWASGLLEGTLALHYISFETGFPLIPGINLLFMISNFGLIFVSGNIFSFPHCKMHQVEFDQWRPTSAVSSPPLSPSFPRRAQSATLVPRIRPTSGTFLVLTTPSRNFLRAKAS